VGLTLGALYIFQSGTPNSKFNAHPLYQNSGEVPVGGRGEAGRNPNTHQIDVHAGYRFPLRMQTDLQATIDVFNILDSQDVLAVDQNAEFAPGEANPEYGRAIRYQRPRTVRLGVRMTF
jgi:outer membrane receptor protein involved in Fe transport